MGTTQTKNSEESHSTSEKKPQTAEEFYNEFRKQLSDDDLNDLVTVFRMINISSEDISKSLCKFMATKAFKNSFKEELANLQFKLNEVRKESSKIQEHLLTHCFGVLYMYSEIIENVHDAKELNNILTGIAMGHGFLTNITHNFKMHDYLLQKFMRDEFEEYMKKNTLNTLRKFMSLTSGRIISLAEHYNKNLNSDSIIKELNHQRGVINSKMIKHASLSEVFINPLQNSSSEYLVRRSIHGVFPGTSKGTAKKLDKKSKMKKK